MHRGAHEFPESFQYYHWYLQGKMCRADIVLAVYWSRQTQHGRCLLQCHEENGRRFVYSYCIVWFLHCLWCSETASCVVCLTSAWQTPTLTPQREWKKKFMHLLHDFCIVFRAWKQCPVLCVWLQSKYELCLIFQGSSSSCMLFSFSFSDGQIALPRVADMYEILGRFLKDLGLLSQVSGGLIRHVLFPFLSLLDGKGV